MQKETKKPAIKKVTKAKPKKIKEPVEVAEKVEINPLLKEANPEEIVIEKDKRYFSFVNTCHEFTTIEVIFIVLVTLLIGVCLGGLTIGLNTKEEKVINTISATDDANFNKIVTTYNDIVKNYYEDIDNTKLIDGAISGMLETIQDPYTSYFDAAETTTFYKRLKGTFIGIGCEIVSDGTNVYVAQVLKDSPAADQGIKAGDIITKIDSTSTVGMTSSAVVALIENSASNNIVVTVTRDNTPKAIEVTKKMVTIESVHSEIYNNNGKKIGYLKIDIFAKNTYTQFKKALETLEAKKIDSLIIDVRGNSGGYLDVVGNITSMFFSSDKVIYQMATKTTTTKVYSTNDEPRTYKIAVLINSGSASGSEILAGAIKEMYHGEVIGTNSFGKSSVQETADLGDGTMIKYTVKKWLTAGGNDIGGFGLAPTIKVSQSETYATTPTVANDTQLQKALTTLSE